jgi:UDP-N-acetylmuramoyl-L-alanyl-D-glutamate--2,6-diaminopimelate ligase
VNPISSNSSNPAIRTAPAEILSRLAAMGVRPSGVADDSRRVSPGDLFMAYPGIASDGRKHIADALVRRPSAILWETGGGFAWNPEWKAANLPITGLRRLRAPIAHAVFGYPSERLSLIAVTGTNGKTTIAHWLGCLYPRRCAIVGTLGAGFAGNLEDTGLTTPEAATLMRCLKKFADESVHACVLEASSIGIEEGRIDGLRIDAAVFTNLTRDHLDYHGGMEAYAAAKEKLFMWPHLRLAVINVDDPFGRELAERTTASKVIVYSRERESVRQRQGALYAEEIEALPNGLRFRLNTPMGRAKIETRVIGNYNVSNLLAVAALLVDAGVPPNGIARSFATLSAPPGRLETIAPDTEDAQTSPLVVVDYAHTPDALENALSTLREQARARGGAFTVVFGCGGNRDAGKRSLMGEVAARLADRVILTNDNPRNESPAAIIEAIRKGAPNAAVIEDRALAIREAIRTAKAADVVLIAGKGRERYQEIAGERLPFSDANEAWAALLLHGEER